MLELCFMYLINGLVWLAQILVKTAVQYPLLLITVTILAALNIKFRHIY